MDARVMDARVAKVVRAALAEQPHILTADLAKLLGCSRTSAGARVAGRTRWRLSELHLISGLLGIAPHELVRRAEA